jgi:hypothetical protein
MPDPAEASLWFLSLSRVSLLHRYHQISPREGKCCENGMHLSLYPIASFFTEIADTNINEAALQKGDNLGLRGRAIWTPLLLLPITRSATFHKTPICASPALWKAGSKQVFFVRNIL